MSQESHDLGPVSSLVTLAGYGDSYVGPGDEVYVVSEDCDYIYRNTGANPPADGFNIVKAVFLPGIWERRNNASAFASLLAPFTGVNNGTVRLLKSISAAELATLREGDTVYVLSLRNYWKWLPTSVLVSDDITISAPTVVGAGTGRFERLTGNESPDWKLQQAWFIDSIAANQEGSGSALSPLASDIELTRRWGSDGAIQLSPQVTITYAQAPTTISNFDVRILDNASVTWMGTPTITKPGTVLTAVTAQVRTAGAEVPWAVTAVGLGAADLGKLIVITASGTPANVGAYARVLKDNGGGSVRVSPFGTFSGSSFAQITPTVGDTISIAEPMTLKVGFFSLRKDTPLAPLAAPIRNAFLFDSITLDGGGAGTGVNSGIIRSENSQILYARSILQNLTLTGTLSVSNNHRLCGGDAGSIDIRTTNAQFITPGCFNISGAIALNVTLGGGLTLFTDTYFQNAQCFVNAAGQVSSAGTAFFDRATANSTISLGTTGPSPSPAAGWRQSGAVPDWGTNNAGHGILVTAGAAYSYVTKPTVNGTLGAGREAQIGGTDKLYGAVPYVELTNLAALVAAA